MSLMITPFIFLRIFKNSDHVGVVQLTPPFTETVVVTIKSDDKASNMTDNLALKYITVRRNEGRNQQAYLIHFIILVK